MQFIDFALHNRYYLVLLALTYTVSYVRRVAMFIATIQV